MRPELLLATAAAVAVAANAPRADASNGRLADISGPSEDNAQHQQLGMLSPIWLEVFWHERPPWPASTSATAVQA